MSIDLAELLEREADQPSRPLDTAGLLRRARRIRRRRRVGALLTSAVALSLALPTLLDDSSGPGGVDVGTVDGGVETTTAPTSTIGTTTLPTESVTSTTSTTSTPAETSPQGATADPATPAEIGVVAALTTFATPGGVEDFAAVTFAPTIALGLGDELVASLSSEQVTVPAAWEVDFAGYAGRAGAASVLETLGTGTPVTIEPEPSGRCGLSDAVPAELAAVRRVIVEPTTASCDDPWRIDVYFADDGAVRAVTFIGA